MTTTTAKKPKLFRTKVGELEVLLAPSAASGLIAAQVYVKRGSVDEAADDIGVTSFTAGMLKRGTTTRSSEQIAFQLESLGAMTSHGASLDTCQSSIRSAAPDFPEALKIFFDAIKNPAFDERELEIERMAVLAHLKRTEDEKFEYTYRNYIKRRFEGHGYGHFPEGEEADVRAITADKCRARHAKVYRPENMLFVAAGDFDPEAFVKVLEPHMGGWPEGKDDPRCDVLPMGSGKPGLHELRKELEQGFIVMGYHTPEMTHADHHALRIASAALGEGFAGRLFTHLRDERSLAYAVGCGLRTHRLGGHLMLYIGTQPERLEEAREGLIDETEVLRRDRLKDHELARALNYVAGKYVMDHQSLASRISYYARWEDLGLGAEYDTQYVADLRKVTSDQVLEAARRWWKEPSIVVLRPLDETPG